MYINARTAHYKAVKEICFTLEEVTHLYECDFFLAYIFNFKEKTLIFFYCLIFEKRYITFLYYKQNS